MPIQPALGLLTGVERPQIGAPSWTPLERDDVAWLVGGAGVLED